MLHLVDKIAKAREDGKYVFLLSLDLRAAFDTLSHEAILSSLERGGLSKESTALISSYLTGRRQRVIMRTGLSSYKAVKTGVPVWGPTLFNATVADIEKTVDAAEVLSYADDFNLFIASDTVEEGKKKLEKALQQFSLFCLNKSLCISPEKTQLLVIGSEDEVRVEVDGMSLSSKPIDNKRKKRKEARRRRKRNNERETHTHIHTHIHTHTRTPRSFNG